MRTIIAGSRAITDYTVLCEAMARIDWKPTVIISGHAKGVDQLGERWARDNDIPLEIYPAKWNEFGKSAGHIRNVQMAERANALVAIWNGASRGTADMIEVAQRHGLKIYVYKCEHSDD